MWRWAGKHGSNKSPRRGTEDDPPEASVATADASPDPVLSAVVARQPICNAALEIVGYELLYRRPGALHAEVGDPVEATAAVIVAAALDIGLDTLVGQRLAYINFPPELLDGSTPIPARPGRIVVEVLETVSADPVVLAGLERMKKAGYQLALDDFSGESDQRLPLEIFDIVKLDLPRVPRESLGPLVRHLKSLGVAVLAEKVETWSEFEQCRDLNCDLFQGYFLQRPQIITAQRVPSDQIAVLRLLADLNDPNITLLQVARAIERDVGLSVRLLRCINSSYYHPPRPVESVQDAIAILGFQELRRLCAAVCLAGFEARKSYIASQALIRARLCEELSRLAGKPDSETYFLTGLLSLLDVLLQKPMMDALELLPLSDPMRRALLAGDGPLGEALRSAVAFEHGDWDRVSYEGLDADTITPVYQSAVLWADEAVAALAA